MNSAAALEARALAAVDLDWQLERLADLVALRTDRGQESQAQQAMAAWMSELGMDVDLWPIDLAALRTDPHYSEEIERDEALGLVGRMGGEGPSLALNGHVDVVGAGAAADWTRPPWQLSREDGVLFGRGVVDMKGALTCALGAARALHLAGIALGGSLSIHSVVGEEDGGCGTLATLRRGHSADAAIVLEPTRLRIAAVHCGSLCFRVRLRGRAAHACVRDEGESAIEKVPLVLDALASLERERNRRVEHPLLRELENPLPLVVGTIRGGTWPSTVPDEVVLEGRCGVPPGQTLAAARDEFESALKAAAASDEWLAEHPPETTWFGGRFEPAETSRSAPIVTTLREAAAAAHEEAEICGVTYGADMRLLRNVGGIPTVMYGPGDVRQAHAPDESVTEVELRACTETLVRTALRWCGTAT